MFGIDNFVSRAANAIRSLVPFKKDTLDSLASLKGVETVGRYRSKGIQVLVATDRSNVATASVETGSVFKPPTRLEDGDQFSPAGRAQELVLDRHKALEMFDNLIGSHSGTVLVRVSGGVSIGSWASVPGTNGDNFAGLAFELMGHVAQRAKRPVQIVFTSDNDLVARSLSNGVALFLGDQK